MCIGRVEWRTVKVRDPGRWMWMPEAPKYLRVVRNQKSDTYDTGHPVASNYELVVKKVQLLSSNTISHSSKEFAFSKL